MRMRFFRQKENDGPPFCPYNIEFRTQHPEIDLATVFCKFPFRGITPPSPPGLTFAVFSSKFNMNDLKALHEYRKAPINWKDATITLIKKQFAEKRI